MAEPAEADENLGPTNDNTPKVKITASSSSSESDSVKSLLEVFAPQLYMFKMENDSHIKSVLDPSNMYRHAKIICPEFHILLDHTIAVIWLVYSDTKNWSKLAPVHLQWALKFLEGIRNKYGNSPRDVNLAINQIQDIILLLYSSYGDKYLETGIFDKHPDVEPPEEKHGTPIKQKMKSKPGAVSTPGAMPDMSHFPEMVDNVDDLSPIEANAPEIVVNEVDSPENTAFPDKEATGDSTKLGTESSLTGISSFPISVTLNDMLSTTNPAKLEKLMQPTGQCDQPSILPDHNDTSLLKDESGDEKEEFCKKLRHWRIEQMQRIESDISRLVSIEHILKDYGAGTQEDNDKLIEMINKRKEDKLPLPGEEEN